MKADEIILWFDEIGKRDIKLAGGKGANLGEMARLGIPVPKGFVVSANAYARFLKKGSLTAKIGTELKNLDVYDSKKLKRASQRIQTAIMAGRMTDDTADEIKNAYQNLCGNHDSPVAVRSSATAEDLPEASFAGQQKSFLNVLGAKNVVKAVQNCWASLFTPRAIFYRHEKGFDHFKVKIAVPVQLMVDSEASGVMFTADPLGGGRQNMLIEAVWGLGEMIVSGAVTPDQYNVDKKTGNILQKTIVPQNRMLGKKGETAVAMWKRKRQKIADRQIKELALCGEKIEKHYQAPQDIEWALSKGKLWIVQTRPVTAIPIRFEKMTVDEKAAGGKLLLSGLGASPGIAYGKARIVRDAKNIGLVRKGEVLVTPMTNPDFVPAMKKASAVVTDRGGRTSHAAIVSREMGVPCVVGTKHATSMLKNGEELTVDGRAGNVFLGRIGPGELKPLITRSRFLNPARTTATKLYVNLAQTDEIESVAQMNVDGVGLLRAEFMMAKLGTHPKELLQQGKSKMLSEYLGERIGQFCAAFAPRPVFYRASDFKTSEYRNLKGGKKFEAEEGNPFIGFRGAARFIDEPDVFNVELDALKIAKNKMGHRNLGLILPFVRTVEELRTVKSLLSSADIRRSGTFRLWIMAEIPANIILLEEFVEQGIDGISIGSNDLTMLTLGVDRDNERIAGDFSEMNRAVLWLMREAIVKARKLKITSSICGQAPSDYPELVDKLVEWGITSISVNPDAVDEARERIYEAEKRLVSSKA